MSNGTIGNGFDWHQTQDHTPGDTNGKCLIVNAEFSAGEFYRTTVTGLCETTTYEFSAWLINLVRANSFCSTQPGGTIPINVSFEIWDNTDTNLLASGNTGNIVESSNPFWQEYGLVFQTLAGQNEVILKMINNGQGGCGNDLAIDDIEFKSCGDIVLVADSVTNTSTALCSTQAPFVETLTVTPDFAVFGSHFYQWQESTDEIVWNDIVGETNQSLSISVNSTRYYRVKVAEVAVNLANPKCVIFSNIYVVTVNQLPIMPKIACWETATINTATCSWDVTGTQPVQPTLTCWEIATFNTITCSWDVTGAQPVQPPLECWETTTFNNTTCSWDVSGMQPLQPTLECWEMAIFNNTTCSWDLTGTQPLQPALECWETTTFNAVTCSWDVTGTQPVQPALECWETATFNDTTCQWDVAGMQPIQPTLECWEIATFNTITCSWDVTGTQPVQPVLECWETATFNDTTCQWDVAGMQPIQLTLECWEIATFNTITCSWDVTGTQPIQPTLECWETATFNSLICQWDIIGEQPGNVFEKNLMLCAGDSLFLQADTNIINPSYIWNTGEITDNIYIDSPGVYSVEISGGTCSFETLIFNITSIENPIIEKVISDGNDIIITILNTGDYEYSLDGINYQTNNTFYNVEGGLYTIYVKNSNCINLVTVQHLHFYIPKFFTPNNDGVHDTFNLSGIEFYDSSEVAIYNRYGKLIKHQRNKSFSWDGTFNNKNLPTSDYWYVIIVEGQKFSGHFTLKR